MDLDCSTKKEAGSDHLICVFGFFTLPNGVLFAFGDFFLLLIVDVEAVCLRGSHRQFILVSDLFLHAAILESIISHLGQ